MPRAGVRSEQPVMAMTGTGQPDSYRDDAHVDTPPRRLDRRHRAQRQARTARVGRGGQPHERRGQGAQGGPPRRKARRHPTHLPRPGRHQRIQRTPATTVTLINTSHTRARDERRSASRRAGDRPEDPEPSARPARPGPRPASPTSRCPSAPRRTAAAPGSAGPPGLRLKTGPFRLWSAFCVVAFVISLFAARLIQLQGIDENDYAAIAAAKGAKTITLEAPRAPIYDRNGEALARTVDASKLVADPTDAHQDATKIAVILHNRLGVDYIDAVSMLRKTSTRYVELARHVNAGARGRSRPARSRSAATPGCTPPRTPSGSTRTGASRPTWSASSTTRATVAPGSSRLWTARSPASTVRRPSRWLTGSSSLWPTARSSPRRRAPASGSTIDRDLQFLAQNRLTEAVRQAGGTSGYAVIQDVKTGQVLALADSPTYDPNKLRAVRTGHATGPRRCRTCTSPAASRRC